jgi:hypothetical protein
MSNATEPAPSTAETKKKTRRWRFQYRLRTLLIFVTVVGVLCGSLEIAKIIAVLHH